MTYWWLPPALMSLLVVLVTSWIARSDESFCDLLAVGFFIVCLPVLIGAWCLFSLFSYLP